MKKILMILSVRAYAIALCVLLGAQSVFAVYFETIEANKDFYIYNVSAKKYIKNNNGQLVMTDLSNASTWQFSRTSGNVSVKNGSHYIKAKGAEGDKYGTKYPGESATGAVTLETSSNEMKIGGDVNGYTFSVNEFYVGWFGSGSGSYTYYFAHNGSKFLTNQSSKSDQSKWQLVSKRQLDNTITLSPASLALEAIQGGGPSSSQFYVNYDGNPTSIILTDGTNTLTISSPDADGQHTVLVSYQVDASGTQTFTLTDGSNAANKTIFSFAAGASASLGLTVSTTAASGDAIEADKKTMTIKGTVSTLKHQYIDWTQDFSALSLTTAPITLNAVAKTVGDTTTGKTIAYSLSSTGVVKIVNNILYVLSEGTTTITAKVAKDATYIGAEKSLMIHVSGVPDSAATITPDNASSTGIYTGTIGGPSETYAFHRAKRQVDLQRCFDNGGQALFDSLYIFGVTTNTDGVFVSYIGSDGVTYNDVPRVNSPRIETDSHGNVIAKYPCNATTPCYVFAKKGNTYVHTRTFDATKTRYDWGTKQNDKHIYFTGYCPFAYMGVTPTEEGWMYFTGGNTNVDIYLDSCQIMGRYKTQSGMNTGYEQYILKLYADVTTLGGEKPNNSFMSGSSAPFVFTSTTKNEGQSYKPHIHIAGKNHLEGQVGSYITQTLGIVDMVLTTLEMDAGISDIYTYSSPIVIKPTELGQYTDLELTDVWKDNTITNGYLKLNANKGAYPTEKVPVVDLGSNYGSLTINGGQYLMRNAAADGNYACNLAVSYRLFPKVVEKAGQKVLLHLYGFGGDMTDSKVTINSGTFMMYKNMYPGDQGYLGEGYYIDQDNFLDLRLPAGNGAGNGASRINGGTFNGISNVSFCSTVISTGASPKNALEYWLCMQEVEVTEWNEDGSAKFVIPSPFIDAYDADTLSYSLVSDLAAVGGASLYGAQSANAYVRNDSSFVCLLLPGDACGEDGCTDCKYQKEAIIFQWATTIPEFNISKEISEGQRDEIQMGGPYTVKVKPSGENVQYQTNQLLYVDFEGLENCEVELTTQKATISFKDTTMPRGQFGNSEEYEIQKHLNLLKTVQADTWYTFTAPFDIHDVSVVETLSEKQMEKMTRSEALDKQAQENVMIFYDIQHFVIPTEEGRASTMTFKTAIADPTISRGAITLTHYNGSNLMTANYYLYELNPDSLNTEGEFGTDATGRSLNIDWTPVKRNTGDTIMYKGKTYAMQFPFCPMCNDLESRTYYDYWSNKMILFHGNGPQWVSGKDKHNGIKETSVSSGSATLVGNSTFADMTNVAGYVHKYTTLEGEKNPGDWFVLETGATVKPTQGYLLYNGGSNGMPTRISRSGEMIYDNNSTTTGIDGIPTIADRTALMILGSIDGFNILSLREQMVTVYNLQGHVIFHQYMSEGQQIHIATAPGVYVVKGESETIKVMVE